MLFFGFVSQGVARDWHQPTADQIRTPRNAQPGLDAVQQHFKGDSVFLKANGRFRRGATDAKALRPSGTQTRTDVQ